ncbi:MAG: sigma 54-interacting transcriptional regulator [Candidatus Coatesbacteria bacterium]|nr:sigma 54-interacting transcriptional regulator [Candidatus Coatesbacteria bacterium]
MDLSWLPDKYSLQRELANRGSLLTLSVTSGVTEENLVLKALDTASCDPPLKLAFLRSHEQMRSVEFPFVPKVGQIEKTGKTIFHEIDMVSGVSITDVPLESAKERTRLLSRFFSTLAELHSKGEFHGNLRPNNVLFDAGTDKVFLLDLGFWGGRIAPGETSDEALYYPPELGPACIIDPRSDIYCFGLIAFDLLSGGQLNRDSLAKLQSADRSSAREFLGNAMRRADQNVLNMVLESTNPEPAKRPQSCMELLELLRPSFGDSVAGHSRKLSAPCCLFCAPLNGRDEVMAQLMESLAKARSRGSGAIRLSGVSGAGKSVIADEFAEACRQKGYPVARSFCSSTSLNPYCSILQLLLSAISTVKGRQSKPLLDSLNSIRRDLQRIIEQQSEQTGIEQATSIRKMSKALHKKSIQTALTLLKREFWVLILDDAQNMLGPSISILSDLWRELTGRRQIDKSSRGGLFVLVTSPRMEENCPPLFCEGAPTPAHPPSTGVYKSSGSVSETIELGAVSEEMAAGILGSILGSKTPLRGLSATLYDTFGGNPAWLSAAARVICLKGNLSIPIDQEVKKKLETSQIPIGAATPEALAHHILANLDGASVRLLKTIAVLAGHRTASLIGSVSEFKGRLIRSIDDLCRLGILNWRLLPAATTVDFRHDVFKRACLEGIGREEMLAIHRKAVEYARKLPPGGGDECESKLNMTYDLVKSEMTEEAFQMAKAFWEVFRETGCNTRALELLNEAILLFDSIAENLSINRKSQYGIELYRGRGDLQLLLSNYDQAAESYEKALEFAEKVDLNSERFASKMGIAEVHRLKGELKRSTEVLAEAKAIAAADSNPASEGLAAHALGKIHWLQGEVDAALKYFKDALGSAELAKNENERGAILHNIGAVFWAKGEYEQALGRFIQAKKSYEKVGEDHRLAVTLNSIGSARAEQSEMTEAMSSYKEALSIFQRVGDRRNASTTMQNMASNLLRQGDFEASISHIEEAISIKRLIGDVRGLAAALITRGEIMREIGDFDGAFRSHFEASKLLVSEGEPLISENVALQIGLDHLGMGDHLTAIFSLGSALDDKPRRKLPTAIPAMLGLAGAHLEIGEYDRSRELCREVLNLLEGARRPSDQFTCLVTLSRVHMEEKKLDDAAICLSRANSILQHLSLPMLKFQLFWALGDYNLKASKLSESYTSYAKAASAIDALILTLPADRKTQFSGKGSMKRFARSWGVIQREMEKDFPPATKVAGNEDAMDAGESAIPAGFDLPGVELTEACDIILSHLLAATPFERACIAIKADSGRLKMTRAMDKKGKVLDPNRLHGPEQISRRVNLTGTPLFIRRGTERPDWLHELSIDGSLVCVPLNGKNERLGAIYLDTPELLEMPGNHPFMAIQSLTRLAAKAIEDSVRHDRQSFYIAELIDRIRLLGEEQSVPPMLLPSKHDIPARPGVFPEIIGTSEILQKVMIKASKVVKTDVTVLITGETGTGKELLARAIHDRSLRREEKLVVINCGAIPRDLVEAELFGFERGAFTGAHKQKKGRLEYGHKGSIFLDEIGELSLDMQVRLLRFLENRTIERVGGEGEIKIDCRIIAATNRDLEVAVKEGEFREDLFYRLSVIHLPLPPIRDRDDDILRLANYFLALGKKKYNKRKKMFSVKAVERMMHHNWPGNVRELQNKVEKAILISSGSTITEADLGLVEKGEKQVARLKDVKDNVEASRLNTVLKASGGNVAQAARMAGLSRQNFYRLVKKHGLSLDEYRPSESD